MNSKATVVAEQRHLGSAQRLLPSMLERQPGLPGARSAGHKDSIVGAHSSQDGVLVTGDEIGALRVQRGLLPR